jgi:hypothetical protein
MGWDWAGGASARVAGNSPLAIAASVPTRWNIPVNFVPRFSTGLYLGVIATIGADYIGK